jgi:Na+-transporting methylmalonyl-CoA/oxaloacetate decarboxylase gamma subunit
MQINHMSSEEKFGAIMGTFFAFVFFWLLISVVKGIPRIEKRSQAMSQSMPLEVAMFWTEK